MTGMIIVGVVVFAIIIAMLRYRTICNGKQENSLTVREKVNLEIVELLKEKNFFVSKECVISDGDYHRKTFYVDDQNKQFALIEYKRTPKEEKGSIKWCDYGYADLINFDMYENDKQITFGNGLTTLAGAALGGVTGAIIGSTVGGKQIRNECNELSVKMIVNDLNNPLIEIPILGHCEIDTDVYGRGRRIADELIAMLSYIKRNSESF
ncbi:MAG: hypothetical protein MJ048_05930 [Acidaminococcaceae bacterium]|nr:hypothetical protein [Acidaminococcaceae bacterium]